MTRSRERTRTSVAKRSRFAKPKLFLLEDRLAPSVAPILGTLDSINNNWQVEQGRSGSVVGVAGQTPLLSEPPTGQDHQLSHSDGVRAEGIEHLPQQTGAANFSPPTANPGTARIVDGPSGAEADGDFVYYRNTVNAAGTGNSSQINEPSIGNLGRAFFETGNWYASVSGDTGNTYGYVDPYNTFPSTGAFAGGFCCDQRVAHDADTDQLFWYMQYNTTGNTASDTNGVRIARYVGATNMVNNNYVYYDFPATSLGYGLNRWLDFPHMQISENFLYFTSSVFDVTPGDRIGSVMVRIPLSELAAGGTINYNFWNNTSATSALALSVNATGVMYAVAYESTTSVRVFSQSEANTSLSNGVVTGLAASYSGTHDASGASPDGRNWTGRSNNRIQSVWVIGNELSMMWNSAQSGSATRPFPFIRHLRMNVTNNALLAQNDLWSTGFAWHYPSIAVNDRGHIGGGAFFSSTTANVSPISIINDDFSTVNWESYFANTGGAGTNSAWGDYINAQQHEQFGNTWIHSGFFQVAGTPSNANIRSTSYWMGRERDLPAVMTPVTDVGDTLAAAFSALTSTGTFTRNNAIWNATHGLRDVDVYRVQTPFVGTTLRADTFQPTNGDSMDTYIRVFNAAGTQLAFNDDGGPGLYSDISVYLPDAAVYYVAISGFNNSAYNPTVAGSGVNGSMGDYGINLTLITGPDISVNDVAVTEGDSGSQLATFTISRTVASQLDITVNYTTTANTATAGADYTTTSGSVVFTPAGPNTITVTVPVLGDILDESNETYFFTITSVINGFLADGTGVGTINDNDPTPSVSLSSSPASVAENGGTSTITATLSAVSGQAVTVNLTFAGTATNGTDYSLGGTSIVVPAGSISATRTLTALIDDVAEGNETATIGINTVTNGTPAGVPQTVTIVDAPPPRVSGVTVNAFQTNTTQRSRVTSLTVTFNTVVTFSGTVAAAFTVSRINGGAVGGFTATALTLGGQTVVTLTGFTGTETEFGSLADGRFTLTVLANQVRAGGARLDGDGNNTGGDDYVLAGSVANGLFRLFGDLNGDGSVSGGDFGEFRLAFGTSSGDPNFNAAFDYDGNGSISGTDFGNFRIRFGTSVP